MAKEQYKKILKRNVWKDRIVMILITADITFDIFISFCFQLYFIFSTIFFFLAKMEQMFVYQIVLSANRQQKL